MVDVINDEIQVHEAVFGLAAIHAGSGAGVCFAAHYTGLRRSDDGGRTWRSLFDALSPGAPLPATCVAVSPCFQTDTTVFAGVPGGIARSSDGGATWSTAGLPSPPPFVSTLVVSPSFEVDGIVLAGTVEDGVFRSSDRGETWQAWNIGLFDFDILCLAVSPDFAADRMVYAGTESGVFYSTNEGRYWRETGFPIDDAPVLSLAAVRSPGSGGMLFAGTESCGLQSSGDGGQSWRRVDQIGAEGSINAILLSPENPAKPQLLLLLDDGLLVSRDGGTSWSHRPIGQDFDAALTAVAAPAGLDPGAPLLVGLVDGRVLRIT